MHAKHDRIDETCTDNGVRFDVVDLKLFRRRSLVRDDDGFVVIIIVIVVVDRYGCV